MKLIAKIFLSGILWAAAHGLASASVVTNCADADLRAAVAGGGTVTFACDGTITLTNTIAVANDTVLDGTGHDVTISGGGSVRVLYNPANVKLTLINVTISGGRSHSGAGILNDGGTVTLINVLVKGNQANSLSYSPGPVGGGGVYNAGGVLNATNCSFIGNEVFAAPQFQMPSLGGAIWNLNGVINVSNCTFTGNHAIGSSGTYTQGVQIPGMRGIGGAIWNNGTMNASACRFLGNYALGGAGGLTFIPTRGVYICPGGDGNGGAIFNSGIAVIDANTLVNNFARGGAAGPSPRYGEPPGGGPGDAPAGGSADGGAIYNAGTLTVRNSTLASNTVAGADGGNGGQGVTDFFTGLGTRGGNGGSGGHGQGSALFSEGTASLVNSTIAFNSGYGARGGNGGTGGVTTYGTNLLGGYGGMGWNGGSAEGCVYNSSGSVKMTNCTVAANSAVPGTGGVGGPGGPGSGPNHPPGVSGSGGSNGSATTGGLLGVGPPVNTVLASNVPGENGSGIIDAEHNLRSDNPMLGPLSDNGGPTLTMALLPGSPAIDAGDDAAAPPTDQRGFARPAGLASDIGAFECTPPIIATPPSSQTAEAGSTVRFYIKTISGLPSTYLWFCDGYLVGCSTNGFLELRDLQFTESGAYSVVITNLDGATTSAPVMLNVIAPVEKRLVPAVQLMGETGSALNLEYTDVLGPAANWLPLDTATLTSTSHLYYDVSEPFAPQRFYRVWQSGTPSVLPSLDLPYMVQGLTLTGNAGDTVRVDWINPIGPTEAWVTLNTVTLTNTSQLYIDVSGAGPWTRLYRIVPVPMP